MANYNERILSNILEKGSLPKEENPNTFFNIRLCEWYKSSGAPDVPILVFQFGKQSIYHHHKSKTLLNEERSIFIGNSGNSVLNDYPFNKLTHWIVRIVRDEDTISTGLYRIVSKDSKERRLLTLDELHSTNLHETAGMVHFLDCKALIITKEMLGNQQAFSIQSPWELNCDYEYYIHPGDIVII